MSAEDQEDPFKAELYFGIQTYYCSADDRIRAVSCFSRSQCEAALKLVGLQKTVLAAVQRRMRALNKVSVVLHFSNHGQDFLRWSLDASGTVIGCEPCQAWLWTGKVVMNHERLRAGDKVQYRSTIDPTSAVSIRYPLERVDRFNRTQGSKS